LPKQNDLTISIVQQVAGLLHVDQCRSGRSKKSLRSAVLICTSKI